MLLSAVILAFAPAAFAPTGESPRVAVQTVAGEQSAGVLEALSAETIRVRAGERSREFPTGDLLVLEFDDRALRAPRDAALVLLANGDRLFLRPEKIDETHLAARWTDGSGRPVRIPLEAVRHVLFDPPRDHALRRDLLARLDHRDEQGDLLLLANGDRVAGEFDGFDGDAIAIETAGGPLRVPRPNVRALGFDPELVGLPAATGRRVIVALNDGSWITGRLQPWRAGPLEIAAGFGETVELPLETVRSLRFLGGRAVYLSDLEPADDRHTSYLGATEGDRPAWRLARDRGVAGGPLSLRGVPCPKGLGMHSRSAVAYDLNGEFAQLRSAIGIDDAAEGGGNAVFAVEVDGRRVYESPPLTGRSAVLPVGPIDVADAKRLTLIVEFGARGDIQDYADWLDAVLVRRDDSKDSANP
ncbi:MAG: NPCBM/NEW2 domain-containing protein [Planctomycetales bacterium]